MPRTGCWSLWCRGVHDCRHATRTATRRTAAASSSSNLPAIRRLAECLHITPTGGHMQGLLPPETSRFDVIGAYYLIAMSWHSGGASKGYNRLSLAGKRLRGNIDG